MLPSSVVFTPPLERRRLQWMEKIANSLRLLEEARQISLSDLQSNEAFVTTLVQASEAAIRNHQSEKIEALRNAVVNSAVGVDIKEDLQLTFIRYISELTPHISSCFHSSETQRRYLSALIHTRSCLIRSPQTVPQQILNARNSNCSVLT